VRERVEEGKAIEALALRMAGLSYPQIADRLEVDENTVFVFIDRQLSRAVNRHADQLRELENLRLDRLQAAAWPEALKGDYTALHAVLAISQHRARMNGFMAPKQIQLSASVRVEMQQALEDLRSVVLSEVVHEALDDGEGDHDD
jgi:hypothetical protein